MLLIKIKLDENNHNNNNNKTHNSDKFCQISYNGKRKLVIGCLGHVSLKFSSFRSRCLGLFSPVSDRPVHSSVCSTPKESHSIMGTILRALTLLTLSCLAEAKQKDFYSFKVVNSRGRLVSLEKYRGSVSLQKSALVLLQT